MRFFLDENVPRILAHELSARSHLVENVRDICPAADDEAVLREAARRAAILVTLDLDFGSLVFLRGQQAPFGVALIRSTPTELAESLAAIVRVLEVEFVRPGMFAVIGRDGFRIRPIGRR